ncbi:hypothetical protein J7L81_05625 [Candidatus Aerophobetes bacterium]|nr:hypothetical protein [Candidatus Aerophobetes bacterium]
MSREFVERWYSSIPEFERDLPIILVDGRVYTPREIYNEVMKGTPLGEKLQMELERLRSPHSLTYEDLRKLQEVAWERVKRIVKGLPKDFSVVSLSGMIVRGEKIAEVLKDSAVNYEMRKIIGLIRR